jgi:hypothetical protein
MGVRYPFRGQKGLSVAMVSKPEAGSTSEVSNFYFEIDPPDVWTWGQPFRYKK